ncbi:MAG: hypothetical protein U0M12_09885 [Acutalibacteraceae bacterium]|nr:hypothetical protein [Acutalibacteraceae bacterium]
MLKFKKSLLLVLALLFCLIISIINVNAVYEAPAVATEIATVATQTSTTPIQVATAITEPTVSVRSAEVEEVDDEQNVYLKNQPFNDTTNTVIVICAVEGGIISILLLTIAILLVKKNRV